MRKVLATAVVGVLVLFGSLPSASAGSLEVRLGAFFPRTESNLFDDTANLFGTRTSDWVGATGGVEFRRRIGDHAELGFHVDAYSRWIDTDYVDEVAGDLGDVDQTLGLTVVPVGFTFRLAPGTKHAPVVPYIGVGPDLIFWSYNEFGDFIDSQTLEVIDDSFDSGGATLGGHAAAGVRLALGPDLGMSAEFKYLLAMKSDMNRDFRDNRLDVSGASATVGFFLNF